MGREHGAGSRQGYTLIEVALCIRPLADPSAARDDVAFWRQQPPRRGLPPSKFSDVRCMEPPRDFCELLECFNVAGVKAIIVGPMHWVITAHRG